MEIKDISVINIDGDIVTIKVEIDNWLGHSMEWISKELQNMFGYPTRFHIDTENVELRNLVFECDVKLRREQTHGS